jgi:hypothetical protein
MQMEELQQCKIASEYDGMYISHMRYAVIIIRSVIDELLQIASSQDPRDLLLI